jgi:hypothetical protein
MGKEKRIAQSAWVDDLTEEERIVLERGHRLDNEMKKNKRIRVGVLDELGIED